MPLVPAAEIVGAACAAGRGVVAFNVIGIEHAEGIVAGAEAAGSAVILQISENCVAYHGALDADRARGARDRARERPCRSPCTWIMRLTPNWSEAAVRLGFGSVMYDASGCLMRTNVAATASVAAWCHERDVLLEAELGEVGGKDGVHAAGARTQPGEAASFVSATGVDALAVAVGSSHAMVSRDAVLDLELVRRIRAAVSVPLVLHGSSGVPDDALSAAVQAGLTKINIATQLNKVFSAAVRHCLAEDAAMTDPRRYLSVGPGRDRRAR